ncbi:RHS repeat-associated core domain-containing protein [Neolewinella agarilytica]|uniref:RHS repeat-associated core domain-containing protein n=1 Tax=Neolewinella agarilytica TaxID=478744 RepID=UPI002352E271|nr:RHS repeat-associated core domain-containing protein [Neolewinella agarilytica]
MTFYLHDHLGNTRVTFRADSPSDIAIEYAADYYPYGKILREYRPCSPNRYLSTHHERDAETGYDNRGARLYDSELGRFLGVDPLASKFQAWSPYNYVLGNPVRLTDPDGRAPSCCGGSTAMGYLREGFRRMGMAASKLIDNAKLTVENAFRSPSTKESVGPGVMETYGETKTSLSASTNLSDAFDSGNWTKGEGGADVYGGPPVVDIKLKTTRSTVSKTTIAGKVEGVDVKLTLSRTKNNEAGTQKDAAKLQVGTGPGDVYVSTDGNSATVGVELQNTANINLPGGKKVKAIQKVKLEYKIEIHQ